jgi:RNA polymerase sigma-70 factor, ECF subfamily
MIERQSEHMSLTLTWNSWQGDPDTPLVQRAQTGDRHAFDRLRHRHDPPLRGFVARRIALTFLEDIVQDTWLSCWVKLPNFAGRARFKAWLYGIAVHKCADSQRARRTEQLDDITQDALASPEDAMGDVDLRETISQALTTLPDAQREVIELYYLRQLTLPEIATQLGRNLNTVKYQLYRAHEVLADVLKDLQHEGARA